MPSRRKAFLTIVILSSFLVSCASKQPVDATSTDTPQGPIQLEIPTVTQISDQSSAPTIAVTSQPQVAQSLKSALIYDDSKNMISIDPETGETKTLISRDELQLILGEDKSAESYTYGYDKPISIDLSPDLKKALVSMCLSLDDKFRCVNEYFVYALEQKNAIRLPKPSDSYGVYWKWSPDGSKLAGAGWTYNAANYEITRFYSVNSDGTDLTSLSSVTNGDWQIAWHPGGSVILPLTYATNFRSIFVDGSKETDIALNGLEWNDKVECLAFSPDLNQVAFVVSQDTRKGHQQIYIARSDFANLSMLTEYDIDSRYLCNMDWSPNQDYIHIAYLVDSRAEAGLALNNLPAYDVLFNIQNGTQLESPQNSRVCGWTPDSSLLYEKIDVTGEPAGVDLMDMTGSNSTPLPDNVKTLVQHCPVQWSKAMPVLNIPQGLSITNACHPGGETQDVKETESISPLFDILSVSSLLSGEDLSVTFHSASASKNLNDYLTPGIPEQFLNGWEVLVDVDNNALTGDKLGIEYRFSVAVKPRPNGNPPGLAGAILAYDSAQNKYVSTGTLQMLYDPDAATLTLTGNVPGINENSRLIFLSRVVKSMTSNGPVAMGDRICN